MTPPVGKRNASSLPLLIAYRICQVLRFVSSAASLTVTKSLRSELTARVPSWKRSRQCGEQKSWLFLIGSNSAQHRRHFRRLRVSPSGTEFSPATPLYMAVIGIPRGFSALNFCFGADLA